MQAADDGVVDDDPGSPRARALAERQLARLRGLRKARGEKGLTLRERLLLESEERKSIELLAKLTGETSVAIDEARIVASPAWKRCTEAIAKALAPFPEATRAVVAALESLE